MITTFIDYRPSNVNMTTYGPYVSFIDFITQTITISKTSSTVGQGFSPDSIITINKEYDLPSVKVTAKII